MLFRFIIDSSLSGVTSIAELLHRQTDRQVLPLALATTAWLGFAGDCHSLPVVGSITRDFILGGGPEASFFPNQLLDGWLILRTM
ncbi:hypothetical protein, partial [Accumulibacter sp.]|uniref:hypothetical protein n=1 Tax=Accumulibacter sp. TaxID=2053492 RepID=UPI0028C4BDE8